jgi:cyanophycinase
MGHILLQGGSEFGGLMQASDRRALELAGGPDVAVGIVPAAAAPDANHCRAGQNGRHWFRSLGASDVNILPLIDRPSADEPHVIDQLNRSRLIYFLGGFPGYLLQTLADTSAWQTILAAHSRGAVIAGSSAGAMVLCEHLFDPQQKRTIKGLNMLPNCCLIPHHNSFGKQWALTLQKELPHATLIGIDEETGAIDDGPQGQWTVYGRGAVSLYRRNRMERYTAGEQFVV